MAYDRKGKAPKVKDRWYGEHKMRFGRDFSLREFVGEPQFTLDDLYITPFTHRRRYSDEGRESYVPVERNLKPTGIKVMDDYLCYLSAGHSDITAFSKRYGAHVGDIDSLVFLLTGMRGVDFRQVYQMRMADDLVALHLHVRCRCRPPQRPRLAHQSLFRLQARLQVLPNR